MLLPCRPVCPFNKLGWTTQIIAEGGSIPIGDRRLGRSAEHTAWPARCPSFAAAETAVGRVAEGDAAGPPSGGRLQEPTTDSQLRFQVPAMVYGKEKVKKRHPYLLELRSFCWHPSVSLSVAVTAKHPEYTPLLIVSTGHPECTNWCDCWEKTKEMKKMKSSIPAMNSLSAIRTWFDARVVILVIYI
jgi:hypothetical protein